MPGVLIVEALAQTGSVAALSLPENKQKLGLFAGINNLRFKRPVVPGDTLRLEVQFDKIRMGIGRGKGVATVDGQLACEGELMFALVNRAS
jgi:3-hydroxyacyl-[acyl-carrier-protein] dehydratase